MLKSIWGAISGDYKMHLVLEDAMDALPTTGTVSFQSKNIPINVTLKSSSDLNHIRVAYKVSSNQPNTKPPSRMKFTDNDNICSLYFNTKDNKAIGGLVVSVGNINYLPLLIEAIIFIPEKMIPKFKLKIDVGSGTLNTNSLVFESLDGNYTSSITFTDISTRITRLKSRENISLRSCDLGNSFITSEKGTIKLKNCDYQNLYCVAKKSINLANIKGNVMKLYSIDGSVDLSFLHCNDLKINHSTGNRIRISEINCGKLAITSTIANINILGCKLDSLKILTKNGPLNITDCSMDAASVKSLDGPVKVLDSKFNILGITSDEAPIDVLSCHSKSVALTSNSGEIELKEIRSINAIRLHSDTGNINIVGRFTTNTWTQSHFAPLQSGLSGMTLHGYEEDVKLTGVVSARTVTGTISCSMQNFEVLDIYSAKGDISLDGTRKAPSIVQLAVLKSREGNIDVKTDSFDGLLESRTLHGECTVDVSDGNTYKLDSTFQSKRYEFKAGKSSQYLQTFVEYGTSTVNIE